MLETITYPFKFSVVSLNAIFGIIASPLKSAVVTLKLGKLSVRRLTVRTLDYSCFQLIDAQPSLKVP